MFWLLTLIRLFPHRLKAVFLPVRLSAGQWLLQLFCLLSLNAFGANSFSGQGWVEIPAFNSLRFGVTYQNNRLNTASISSSWGSGSDRVSMSEQKTLVGSLALLFTRPATYTVQVVSVNTMNIDWQAGVTKKLVVERYIDKENTFDFEPITSQLESERYYTENEYYMIIIKPSDTIYGGASGFTKGLSKNWFMQICKYDDHTPMHELGHCNGLDEFVIDIGSASVEGKEERLQLKNNTTQKNNSNVMGYKGMGYIQYHYDFFSWQIAVIREEMKLRIKK